MANELTILKNPALQPSEDYSFLRQKGVELIENLGSKFWTDYNIHDPGINILEALCYAITDLAYRTSFDIKDLLAEEQGTTPDHNRQGFYTARNILTVNPWTTTDWRKLLVDIVGVKNAWLFCKDCPCDSMFLYANCAKSKLQYSPMTEHTIIMKGFYDVLVEFEDEDGMGNLNSGKIKYNFSFATGVGPDIKFATASVELRLPSWQKLEDEKAKYKNFRNAKSVVTLVDVKFISGNKGDNTNIPQDALGKALRKPLFATIEVSFHPDKDDTSVTEKLLFEDVPITVWFSSDADRKALELPDLAAALSDSSASGALSKYADKIKRADEVMKETRLQLHSHRNLAEDFCTIKSVNVEDIAVCADMDVTPDADIERVLAEAYYLIDQYFSPDIKFYTLKQLLDSGTAVDEIFDGPALNNGFIKTDEIEATQLKKVLYASDVINLLMDIEGVVAVRNLVLVRYDAEGNRVQSESWVLPVSYQHQPRLYIEGSKVLVFKNGLPFLPDRFELWDTLQMIKGLLGYPSYPLHDKDLAVPEGTYHPLQKYFAVQNTLPLTYGVGTDGLKEPAAIERKAQAKQLKAYLLMFEQLLVNYLAQLAHVKDLFAIDTAVKDTYFSYLLQPTDISGITELYGSVNGSALDENILDGLVEDDATFLNRRNRFLDHLLSRFAESFSDYALMLYSYSTTKAVADATLINDKIAFLKDIVVMTHDRAKAFNYKDPAHVCSKLNTSGLTKRIQRLLGFKLFENNFELYEEKDTDGISFERRWRLIDGDGKIYISGSTKYKNIDFEEAQELARKEIREVMKYILDESRYTIHKDKKWVLNLTDPTSEVIATRKQHFAKKEDAEAAMKDIIEFAKKLSAAEKIFLVEHILLRPRNKPGATFPTGDPLLPICIGADCELCGEEDPYSFRLTIVMNGEEGIANSGIEFRRFAEQTIRQEVPAHLGIKICWVDTEQLLAFETLYCAWLAELAKEEFDATELHNKLVALLELFVQLKSVYPKATLHDCVDGNDENRVYLNQTIV